MLNIVANLSIAFINSEHCLNFTIRMRIEAVYLNAVNAAQKFYAFSPFLIFDERIVCSCLYVSSPKHIA